MVLLLPVYQLRLLRLAGRWVLLAVITAMATITTTPVMTRMPTTMTPPP
ncbi:hypothetical protein ACFV0R_29050 [Streptomyces sp. NPDC059578]